MCSLKTLVDLSPRDFSASFNFSKPFSKDHEQLVSFRDGDFVTPKYTYYGGTIYSNETGEAITEPTEEVQNEIDSLKEKVDKQLAVSDQINNGDLLRFYTNSGLDPIDTSDYDYKNGLEKLKEAEKSLGDKSTSVFSQHNGQSTVDLYKTQTYQELHGTTTSSSE